MSSISLLDDDEHFKRCFGIFRKRLQQEGTLTEWLCSNVLDDIQSKVASSVAGSIYKDVSKSLWSWKRCWYVVYEYQYSETLDTFVDIQKVKLGI